MKLSKKAKELNQLFIDFNYDKIILSDKKLIAYYSSKILFRAANGYNRCQISEDERYYFLLKYFESEGFEIYEKEKGIWFVVGW